MYGEKESDYLNATNYDYTSAKQDDINNLIGKLRYAMNDYKCHPYLKHQKDNHGNIPLWVLTRVLTIGIISKMFGLLKPAGQTMISKEFDYVAEEELAQMIALVSRFRNVCAHNERLYDYKYIRGEIRTTGVHKNLKLRKKNGYYLQGKKDLFAVVIVFKYLLDPEEFEGFLDRFDELTDNLLKKTSILQRSQVLKLMGFPENWKDIKDCGKALESGIEEDG